jgi:hypothetical protein
MSEKLEDRNELRPAPLNLKCFHDVLLIERSPCPIWWVDYSQPTRTSASGVTAPGRRGGRPGPGAVSGSP